jgi:hypothetical protein
MFVFNAVRGLANPTPDYSDLVNVANDALLIFAWGAVMAYQEREIATDAPREDAVNPAKFLQVENAARAKRQTMALARRARDVAPQS